MNPKKKSSKSVFCFDFDEMFSVKLKILILLSKVIAKNSWIYTPKIKIEKKKLEKRIKKKKIENNQKKKEKLKKFEKIEKIWKKSKRKKKFEKSKKKK